MVSRELLFAKVYAALESKQPRTLEEIVDALGVSRMTAFRFLKELVSKQLVRREEEIHGRGRPRVLFYATKNLERMIQLARQDRYAEDSILSIPFSLIKSMCRHHKGGMCKALLPKLQRCEVDLCPSLNRYNIKV
jgi:predicted transcriptional regulator